ncbi:MAG: hypothetical protein V8R80_07120 [Eubacterium sp.]
MKEPIWLKGEMFTGSREKIADWYDWSGLESPRIYESCEGIGNPDGDFRAYVRSQESANRMEK